MLTDNYKTYRESDPETSRQPVENKNSLKAVVLRVITEHPGITAGELGEVTGIDGIWKRLPELEKDGLINRAEPRFYSGTQRYQTTWHPVGERQLSFDEVSNE